jgi:hypothetical protein
VNELKLSSVEKVLVDPIDEEYEIFFKVGKMENGYYTMTLKDDQPDKILRITFFDGENMKKKREKRLEKEKSSLYLELMDYLKTNVDKTE